MFAIYSVVCARMCVCCRPPFGCLVIDRSYGNLSATGGILTLATGFRVAKIKSVPILNMIPALVLIFSDRYSADVRYVSGRESI